MASQLYTDNSFALSGMANQQDDKRPYQYEEVVSDDDRLTKATTTDQKMKHKIRRLRVFQRTLNLLVSAAVLGIMSNTYVTFARHRTVNNSSTGGQTIAIYPVDPITWPTFMMIATGGVSLLFNVSIVISYYCGVATSNRVSQYSSYWSYLVSIANIIVWLATSTTFQMLKGPADAVPPPRDIFGWTCSNASDKLTSDFTLPVNFDLQCKTQQASFAVGIANAGAEILSICINIYAFRRLMHKKRMERMQRT